MCTLHKNVLAHKSAQIYNCKNEKHKNKSFSHPHIFRFAQVWKFVFVLFPFYPPHWQFGACFNLLHSAMCSFIPQMASSMTYRKKRTALANFICTRNTCHPNRIPMWTWQNLISLRNGVCVIFVLFFIAVCCHFTNEIRWNKNHKFGIVVLALIYGRIVRIVIFCRFRGSFLLFS